MYTNKVNENVDENAHKVNVNSPKGNVNSPKGIVNSPGCGVLLDSPGCAISPVPDAFVKFLCNLTGPRCLCRISATALDAQLVVAGPLLEPLVPPLLRVAAPGP